MRSMCVSFLTCISGNKIGKEGAEALARSLERNSSLTSLDLSGTLCRNRCVPCACHFSRVFRQSDRKGRGESTGAKSGAQLVPHLSPSHMYTLQTSMRSVRVSFLTCIQGMRSEMKGQKHWREVWSATPPSPLSISHVYSADIDAFHVHVISDVYSVNWIGKEGAEALARSLERNSSLTSLDLFSTLCRNRCIPCACRFSRVFRQSDRKGRGESTGAKFGAQLVPHLSPSLKYTLQIWMRSARVSFLTCIQ
jgi:hypothetical protein